MDLQEAKRLNADAIHLRELTYGRAHDKTLNAVIVRSSIDFELARLIEIDDADGGRSHYEAARLSAQRVLDGRPDRLPLSYTLQAIKPTD